MKQWTVALAIGASALAVSHPAAQRTAESRNIVLVSQNDLNGGGDGGEGLALQQLDGRRLLYFPHEGTARCLSAIDVTRPEIPSSSISFRRPDRW